MYLVHCCTCTTLYYVPDIYPVVPVIYCTMYLEHCCNFTSLYYGLVNQLYMYYTVLCTWNPVVPVIH